MWIEGFIMPKYIRKWIKDLRHPRIHLKAGVKNPSGGRVYEHILIMEKKIKRYMEKTECVHHLDGDKSNNKIGNLYLCRNHSHHNFIHNQMEKLMFDLIKKGFVRFDRKREKFVLNKKKIREE